MYYNDGPMIVVIIIIVMLLLSRILLCMLRLYTIIIFIICYCFTHTVFTMPTLYIRHPTSCEYNCPDFIENYE